MHNSHEADMEDDLMKIISFFSNIIKNLRQIYSKCINYILGTSRNYYTCLYPGNSGIITSFMLNRIFSKIRLEKRATQKLNELNEKGIIIYTGKYKSFLDFLYFHTIFKNAALPYPEICFNLNFFFLLPLNRVFKIIIFQMDNFLRSMHFKNPYTSGYINDELLKGRSAFLSLFEDKGFYKRFVMSETDPLRYLIEFQKKIEKPVYFIPQTIIFISKPLRSTSTIFDILLGTNEKPGRIKRLFALLKNPDKICVEISEPVNLKQFLEQPDMKKLDTNFQAHALRKHLTDILNRQRKSVTGPVLKSRDEITEEILVRSDMQHFMEEYAKKRKIPLKKVRKKASEYIMEIASNYNLRTIHLFDRILTWMFNHIFEGIVIDQDGLDLLKEESKKAPLILSPCHKSHLDYLLLSYVMFKNNMPCPQIAAGKNLSFWPLGPIFRGGGAFFLRRTFKGAELYSKIFAAYIEKLLSQGFNIEFFIEGGRSRTGKLLSPKFGLLSIFINAHKNKACEDLLFAPVYVGYDRVLEENAYLNEIEGGKKNPENLSQLIRARKFLKTKYGKVYIRFGKPISLNDYLDEKKMDTSSMDEKQHKELCKNIGYRLINSINSISIVTSHGIVAGGILNCPNNRFSKKDLMFRVQTYMDMLIFFNAGLADTLLLDPDYAFNNVIETFVSRKFIELADESDPEIRMDTRFIVKDNKRPILDYYKNNAISFFVSPAYTAIAILGTDTFQFSSEPLTKTYKFLQNFFIDEFSFNEDRTCEEDIIQCLRAFTEQGIIVPNPAIPDTYNITSEGYRKLKCFAGLLNPFLESYKVALIYFETNTEEKHDSRERIKKIQSLGIKMYRHQEILLKESLSKINYINASKFFLDNGICGPENKAMIEKYKSKIDWLLSLASV